MKVSDEQPTPPVCPHCGRATNVRLLTRAAGRETKHEIWECWVCERMFSPTLSEDGTPRAPA